MSDIFKLAVDNMNKAGKTVIVSSQNPSVSVLILEPTNILRGGAE